MTTSKAEALAVYLENCLREGKTDRWDRIPQLGWLTKNVEYWNARGLCGRCNKRLADSEEFRSSNEDSYAVYDMRDVDFEMDGFYNYYFVRPGWCQRCADREFFRWERRYYREREARLEAEKRRLARKQLADEQEHESEPYPDNYDRTKKLSRRARNRRR